MDPDKNDCPEQKEKKMDLLDVLEDIAKTSGIFNARLGRVEARLDKLVESVAFLEARRVVTLVGKEIH